MPIILALVGIVGILLAGLMFGFAIMGGGLAVAIVLPAALLGVLLSFMLLGVGEMLRVLWMLEKRGRREAAAKSALDNKIKELERAA